MSKRRRPKRPPTTPTPAGPPRPAPPAVALPPVLRGLAHPLVCPVCPTSAGVCTLRAHRHVCGGCGRAWAMADLVRGA